MFIGYFKKHLNAERQRQESKQLSATDGAVAVEYIGFARPREPVLGQKNVVEQRVFFCHPE